MKEQHIQEWQTKGLISDKEVIFDVNTFNPNTFPENPFDYIPLIASKEGIDKLHPINHGKEVAIIGAGCAGLCAAYELMRVGLRPVVYEASERIGGRTYTHRFEKDPKAYTEIGAMRVPTFHDTIQWYMNRFGVRRRSFPSPLKVPTVIYFDRKRYDVPAGGELPEEIQSVVQHWDALINPIMESLDSLKDKPVEFSKKWQALIKKYEHKSIYQVLHEAGWSKSLIDSFGSIGAGGAGFGPFYHQVSFTEPLRIMVAKWWGEVEEVIGGIEQIPLQFWDTEVETDFWGKTSVKALNYGQTRKGVVEIETTEEGIYLTDAEGRLDKYETVIVTCTPRNLEMSIKINRPTFSEEVWNAIRNTYLIPGGRICIRTKTAFWKKYPELISCTVTDEPLTHLYLFDFEDTQSGVICLSYTLGITAIKFDAFDDHGKVENVLRELEKIYSPETVKMIREQMVEEPVCFSWEEAPGYNGSFKMPVPGFNIDDVTLFSQGKFKSDGSKISDYDTHPDVGVYLAGDCVGWSSGWIETALHTGINSALSVIYKLNRDQKEM